MCIQDKNVDFLFFNIRIDLLDLINTKKLQIAVQMIKREYVYQNFQNKLITSPKIYNNNSGSCNLSINI